MESKEGEFDLTRFLPQSLHLGDNLTPDNKRSIKPKNETDYLAYIRREDPFKLLGETNDWKPQNVEKNYVGTPIQEFFKGLNIFITGGTGFVGKVLFQKLIRSIPHIGQVYLMIRPKKGKLPQERLSQVLEDKVSNVNC